MSNMSIRHANRRNGLDRRWSVSAVLVLALADLTPTAGNAYTAAGDRNFPATLILPQVAPSDAFWSTLSTQPIASGDQTQFTGTYSKAITERLGIQFENGLTRLGHLWGAQNLNAQLQYEAIINQPHEFVLSVQVNHEFGGTGRQRVGSSRRSATQPG